MKKRVVNYEFLPPRLPWAYTILLYLFLDKMEASEWIWGAVGFFVFVWWITSIVSFFKCEFDNPFNPKDHL